MINKSNILQTIFFGLVISVISIISSIFIINNINNQSNKPLPITVNVFGANITDKAKDEINNNIRANIENLYERSIAKLELSIALFSCALVLFTIVFGFFYFFKIRESEKLIEEIQTKTDEFFKRYYRNQYNKNISDLFSDNNIKRSNALKNISNNPEISNDDFDIIKAALQKEFSYKRNAFIYGNISSIINILISIDNKKTIDALISILKANDYDHMKMFQLLQYIVVDELENTKIFIKDVLKDNSALSTQMVSILIQYDVIDEYSEFILESGAENVLQQLIGMTLGDFWKVNITLTSIMKRNNISDNIFNLIINNKLFSTKERTTFLLHFYSLSGDKSHDNRVSQYINSIKDDENSKAEFLEMVKQYGIEEKMALFFKEYKYYFDYFKNIPLISEYSILSENKKDDNISSLLRKYNIKIIDGGKIIDGKGKEYPQADYTQTLFGLQKPISCIEVEGKIISTSDIEKLINGDNSSHVHS